MGRRGEKKGMVGLRGKGKSGPRERGKGKQAGCWALPSSFSFLFSLLLSTTQTNLFEFKKNWNSNPMNSTQRKQCSSMNAQTC
jgi:hypothetical protein